MKVSTLLAAPNAPVSIPVRDAGLRERGLPDRTASRSVPAQAFAIIDQGCLSASTFGTTALLAHSAGLDVVGTFSIVWMVVLLINAAQNALVTAPMASLAPSDPAARPAFHRHYVASELRFLAGLGAASAAGVGLTVAIHPAHMALVISSTMVIMGYQAYDFVRRFAHAIGRHLEAATLSAAVAGTQLGLLAFLRLHGDLTIAVAFVSIALTMTLLPALAATRIVPLPSRGSRDPLLARRTWDSSSWLLGSAVMQWTCGNIFVLLSPAYIGLGGAGAMRAAQSIVGVVNIWFLGLENVIPLHAGKLWREQGPRAAMIYVARVTLIWTAITGLFVAIVFRSAEPLLRFVYGAQASQYQWVLEWFAVLQLLMFLSLPLRSLLRAAEHTRPIFIGYIAATTFSLCGALPLLRSFGLAGVLIGLTISQVIFQSVLAASMWRRYRAHTTYL
jgi:O-antigen/teichoic acid export membrane protein